MERMPQPFLLLFLATFSSAVFAGDSRYSYDELGRLHSVSSDAGTTEYRYDPVGNILEVATTAAPDAPELTNVDAQPIRADTPAIIEVIGDGLAGGQIILPDGFSLSDLRFTDQGLRFRVTTDDTVEAGIHVIHIDTPYGRASFDVTVYPGMPELYTTPVPIALPPDGSVREFLFRFSHPDAIPHEFALSLAESGIAQVVTTEITMPAGQRETKGRIAGLSAGQTTLRIESPTLGSYLVPVFVTDEFWGVNSSFAPIVSVQKEAGPPPPGIELVPNLAAPELGVLSGSAITGLDPKVIIAGTGSHTVRVTGIGLDGVLGARVEPDEGLIVGPFTALPDGSAVELPVEAAEDAPPTIRRVIIESLDGSYPTVPADADRLRIGMPTPLVHSIEPLYVFPGDTAVPLRIRGERFLRAHRVSITPSDGISIDVTPQVNGDATIIDTRISVAPDAELGERVVTVTTDGGTSSAVPTPANTLHVVLDTAGQYPNLLGNKLGVLKESVPPPAVVPTGDGVSAAVGVVVASYVSSLQPAHANVGTTLTVTVSGAGLDGVDSLAVTPPDGITVGAPVVNAEGTEVTFELAIAEEASVTLREIGVFASGEAIHPVPAKANRFQVTAPPPVIQAVEPTHFQTGTSGTLTLRGRYFQLPETVRLLPGGEGLTFGEIQVSSSGNRADVPIDIALDAPLGNQVVQFVTMGGESTAVENEVNIVTITDRPFQSYMPVATALGVTKEALPVTPEEVTYGPIDAPAIGITLSEGEVASERDYVQFARPLGIGLGPVATTLSPNALLPGESGELLVTGHGLGAVTGIGVTPSEGVTIGEPVLSDDGTALTVFVAIAVDATPGQRTITLASDGDGVPFVQSSASLFRVGHGTPLMYSIEPILGGWGDSLTLLVRGKNLSDAIRIFAEPADGIAIGHGVSVNEEGTEASVPLSIAPDAPFGPRVIRIEVPGAVTSGDPHPSNTFTVYESIPH